MAQVDLYFLESREIRVAHIFISYRRDDTAAYAGRLYDNLSQHFGEDQIFMDIRGIEPGADFTKVIEQAVSSSKVMLVLIGRNWLTVTDALWKRRLDNPYDFVRLEIVAALNQGVRVIPVLVQGAMMPRSQNLPDVLAPLTRRNAIELTDARWKADIDRLILGIEKIVAVQEHLPRVEAPNTPQPPQARTSTSALSQNRIAEAGVSKESDGPVFVCYAHNDLDFVLALVTQLKERGVDIWIDKWFLVVGDDWNYEIDIALRNCTRFVIVLSPVAVESPEVQGELRTALDERKRIVPVLYQPCVIPRQLRTLLYADFTSGNATDQVGLEHLLRAITSSPSSATRSTVSYAQSLSTGNTSQRGAAKHGAYNVIGRQDRHVQDGEANTVLPVRHHEAEPVQTRRTDQEPVWQLVSSILFLMLGLLSVWVDGVPILLSCLLISVGFGWVASLLMQISTQRLTFLNILVSGVGGLIGQFVLSLFQDDSIAEEGVRLFSVLAPLVGAYVLLLIFSKLRQSIGR